MRKNFTESRIRLRGVRQNNLKGFDLDLPVHQFVVVTGLSGSGKSSLAFETLFAEGQRRYIETFSPYARQFLDRMDKPKVDSIEGIPPAIAIEQRNTVRSTRSTVGTMTEICDYTKLFWPRLARLHCSGCGKPVQMDSPGRIWSALRDASQDREALITFVLPLSTKFPLAESLALIERQGYQRLLLESSIVRIQDSLDRLRALAPSELTIVQDRLRLSEPNRARFTEACEQAFHFGHGKLAVNVLGSSQPPALVITETKRFSNRLHCAECDLEYREPSPALFSFNHPVGACPTCRGFGRIITIDYAAALPDRSKTLSQGVVKPWQTGTGAECQTDMERFAKKRRIPMDVPFEDLPKEAQDWLIEGDPGYGTDKDHEWPNAWYGVKGYFRWLESKAYKMHVRVLLSRYRAYQTCPQCHGTRFQKETLLYRLGASVAFDSQELRTLGATGGQGITISDFYRMPITRALQWVEALCSARPNAKTSDPLTLALEEVRARLNYLVEAGLGYLNLDRSTRSLSGGETERVNLTTCLGSRLVNTLFVLDEPSVGLHARDTQRLVRILERLRDAQNSVVVVEHEAAVMRAADHILDLGPGHGESGGNIVFQGSYPQILDDPKSLTGRYLSGAQQIPIPTRRPVNLAESLTLRHARLHNLKDLTLQLPLGRFVCVTGVSGSGKTTLIREELLPALERKLKQEPQTPEDRDTDEDDNTETLEDTASARSCDIEGWERISRAVLVDQSSLGRTPRSNPAVYIGAFDDIRTLFAQTEAARKQGLNASAFSFNSGQGQCERCRGAGFEKIEMQFLSDVFIRCPDCQGRRYRAHILEVTLHGWSVADLLEATVDEVLAFLQKFPDSRHAQRASATLALLQEVGLGYLRLGQPINTLSGGESQRLKLVSHLASVQGVAAESRSEKPILFLFDEPTTGLHFDDIRVLMKVFQRLVDAGHSVLVIEHNLDVIKSADWVIDLGPEGGDEGGHIVVQGPPETIAKTPSSHTGRALKDVL